MTSTEGKSILKTMCSAHIILEAFKHFLWIKELNELIKKHKLLISVENLSEFLGWGVFTIFIFRLIYSSLLLWSQRFGLLQVFVDLGNLQGIKVWNFLKFSRINKGLKKAVIITTKMRTVVKSILRINLKIYYSLKYFVLTREKISKES